MSYKTYTTEAIVCGSHNHNTSDKSYLLFSKEAGMVYANARSVREERSKQRNALQECSLVRVSLVKGRSGWRIGSAEALGNPFLNANSRTQRGVVTYAISQLRRYVHGEVPLPQVYDDALELIEKCGLLTDESQCVLLKQLFSARLLFELGYIAAVSPWEEVVKAQSLAQAHSSYTEDMGGFIAKAIHEASRASHL